MRLPWRSDSRQELLGIGSVALELTATLVVCVYLLRAGGITFGLASLVMLLPTTALAAVLVKRGNVRRHFPLLQVGLALNLVGLLTLAVVAPGFAHLQAVWSVLALGAYLATTAITDGLAWVRRYHAVLFAFSFALVLLTFAVGTNPSGVGPKQWLALGPLYFQPSELLKLALAIFLAACLSHSASAVSLCGWWPLAVIASVGIVALQGDLGAAFVLAIVSALVINAATGQWRHLLVVAIFLGLACVGAYLAVPRVRVRFEAWLNPWQDPLGLSYQVVQALRAFAAGHVTGRGLLLSDSLHIPAAHTDLILAAIAERLGLLATLSIVSLYAMLLAQIRRRGKQASCSLSQLVCLAVAALLVGQAVLIAAGNSGLLPLTGVTLPFVSYGGSSLLVSYMSLGLLVSVCQSTGQRPRATGEASLQRTNSSDAQLRQEEYIKGIYVLLALALAVVSLWLSVWHLYGSVILEQKLAGA